MTMGSSKKLLWTLLIGIGSISLVTTFVIFGFGIMLLSVTLPQDIYDSVHEGQWKPLNVHRMEFDDPDDFSRTEKTLQQRISRSPDDPIPCYLLGALYETMDRNEDAIRAYKEALRKTEATGFHKVLYGHFSGDAHAELALLYYYTNNKEQALAELREVDRIGYYQSQELLTALQNVLEEPQRGEFHFELGVELRRILRLDRARQEIALAYDSATDPALKTKAGSWLRIKLPQQAKPLSPLTRYYTLAGATHETVYSNPAMAAMFYEKAIAEDPSFEWAYSQLGIVNHEMKRYDEAMANARKAAELNPGYISPWLTMGDVEIDRKNYASAIAHYSRALALSHDAIAANESDLVANIQNQIGYAYEQMGINDKAVAHYEQARSLAYESSPDYEYALDALERIQ